MKKIIVFLVFTLMVFAFVGCGDDKDSMEPQYDAGSSAGDYDDSYDAGSSTDDYDDDRWNLGNYDENNDGEISTDEFQDATNDYLDENGY